MESSIMKEILKQADRVASSFNNILIVGEYGSGRSWLAKRIHQKGNRRDKPFITVNCRILEEHDALKKVFGYLALSKDGARINHGVLEQSRGGIIFFENFNSFPENLQQELIHNTGLSQIRRIGSKHVIEINRPQVICSIEIKPSHILHGKQFLNDALLTNNPYILGQPPLRQRREDIASLIEVFLGQGFRTLPEAAGKKISPGAIYQCIKYHWPGNVNQLKNAIKHAAITSGRDTIQAHDLPISIKAGRPGNGRSEYDRKSPSYEKAERQLITKVLGTTDSLQKAAKALGIDEDTLSSKIKQFNLLEKAAY